jgi:hypothetical protein
MIAFTIFGRFASRLSADVQSIMTAINANYRVVLPSTRQNLQYLFACHLLEAGGVERVCGSQASVVSGAVAVQHRAMEEISGLDRNPSRRGIRNAPRCVLCDQLIEDRVADWRCSPTRGQGRISARGRDVRRSKIERHGRNLTQGA